MKTQNDLAASSGSGADFLERVKANQRRFTTELKSHFDHFSGSARRTPGKDSGNQRLDSKPSPDQTLWYSR
jgi:hypothetical protein